MRGELPAGWASTTLDALAQINPPGAATAVPDDQEVTFVPMAAVEELSGRMSTANCRKFGEVKKGFTRFRDGDVLFAKITPCMENGKITVARGLKGGVGCGSTEFHVLRPNDAAEADYIRYFLVRTAYRREAQSNMQGAVGQQRVPTDFLRLSSMPLAPQSEQRRIVSRIEELFSEIDAGERALERVRKLVDRYRQSVLKAAVTGELTREWRLQQADNSESGSALLEQILRKRRAALGTSARTSVASPSRIPGLAELPTGWCLATLDQLTMLVTSGSRGWKQLYSKTGSTFIRAQNIKHDKLELDDAAFVNLDGVSEGLRTKVITDDILITITGANVTKSARVEIDLADAYVSQHVALVRPANRALSRYLYHWIVSSANGRAQLVEAAYGAGKPGLSLDDLRSVVVPLPPLSEQIQIAEVVEVEMSRLTAVLAQNAASACASAALRQAVLKAAFSGQLIPQDPADEPASALLARLAAQANDTPPAPRRRGRAPAGTRP